MSENDSTNVRKFTHRLRCISCGKRIEFEVTADGFRRWQEGELIQCALPELSKSERELMISGVCGGCFDAMFGSEDDEEGEDDVALPDLHGTDDRGSDGEWGRIICWECRAREYLRHRKRYLDATSAMAPAGSRSRTSGLSGLRVLTVRSAASAAGPDPHLTN